MLVEESIRRDAHNLNRLSSSLSISKARRVVYDFSFMEMLIKRANVQNLDVEIDYHALDDGENIVYTMEDNLQALEHLANRVLKMYKGIDFYCYFDSGYAHLSSKDKVDILYSFLDEFLPELLKMYKDLYEKGHIFGSNLGTALGESFIMPSIDSYYIALNHNQENDIYNLETIIHELLHIYASHFLRNYDWKKTQRLLNGLSAETVPLYGELAFFDYLVRNNIAKESAYFHRNYLDYNTLYFFQIIKFFCHYARQNPDDFNFNSGISYEFTGKKVNIQGEGMFSLTFDEVKNSELVNFAYGIGGIEAYNLYHLEKMGVPPKKIIDTFLLNQGDDDHLTKDIINMDLSFMKREVKSHQLVLERIRPLTGFHQE